jgi:predicted transcriptional regulator
LPTVLERVQAMKNLGYENIDIAELLGISEAEVSDLLQGKMSERIKKLSQMTQEDTPSIALP